MCCTLTIEVQGEIKFNKKEIEVVDQEGAKTLVSLRIDPLSKKHFYVSRHYESGDSSLTRYHSKEKNIKIEKVKDLERETKILIDGLHIHYDIKEDAYSETTYVMGKREGLEVKYIKGVLDLKTLYKGDVKEETYFYPDGNVWAKIWQDRGNAPIRNIKYVKEYYPSGNVKRNDAVSEGGYFHSKEHYTPDGRDTTFNVPFMSLASFPGGENFLMAYLNKNLIFKGTEGRVIARFVVTKEGNLKDITILKSLNPDSDAEVIRVLKSMPKWIPGVHKGEIVEMFFTIPILFKWR